MSGKNESKTIPYDCIVIGAGPSGLMAAITAARAGADVLVLEHRDKPLKKLYATGNGRCNFTNMHMDENVYRGSDPSFAYEALKVFGRDELLDFMHGLGLMTRDIDDYVYPHNEQARAVADALLLECRKLGIEIRCSEDVVNITKDEEFAVSTRSHIFRSKKLIIAAGGKAAPTHGSDGSTNRFIRAFGHEMVLQYPALVPLKVADRKLSGLSGVRVKCRISLTVDDKIVSEEQGEIIFNKDSISRIPVMQVSRYAVRAVSEGKDAALCIDLFPDRDTDELAAELETAFDISGNERRNRDMKRDRTALEALSLCINDKLAVYCLKEVGITPMSLAGSCSKEKTGRLAAYLKNMEYSITGSEGFDRAQVTSGGVNVSELTQDMESRMVPGLYIVGELCDIDGTCGGYNLQWAFTSGYIAGSDILR